jgi:capsular exopolysaccharide synthesis family protein
VDESEAPFDWRRYASALIRYKWIVVAGAVLGAGAAYLSWKHVVTGEYVAGASLWIQPEGNDQGPIVTEGLLQATSWLDLVESYAVLDSVVLREKLYVVPAPGDLSMFETFQIGEGEQIQPGSYRLTVSGDGRTFALNRDGTEVARGTAGVEIGAGLGFVWTPPLDSLRDRQQIAFEVMSPRNAAAILRNDLVPTMDPRGTFIRLALTGSDPQRLAAVVNSVMERHVALAAELKSGHLNEQTAILGEQLVLADQELRDAEQALEDFRIRTITLPSEQGAIQPGLEMTRAPVFNEFFETRLEQEDIRHDRERLEQVLANLPDSAFPVEAIELIPSVMSSAELKEVVAELVRARLERRSLLERYTPEYQGVREVAGRIRTLESSTIPALLRQLVGQLSAEERVLAQRIEASGADLSAIPSRTIEEARLRRRVSIADNLFTTLRGRYETTKLAQQSSLADVRILDRAAVSSVPRGADARVAIAAVLFLGLLGSGMAGAIMLDRLDPHMRTPDEVATVLGLAVLGVVPRIRRESKSPTLDQAREAFRTLRTNLGYAYGTARPMVLTISSPGASEGKTLVTTNLGLCFAELGKRTLVIDGDTRRGEAHRTLGCDRKPGLTDLLSSSGAVDDVIQTTAHPFLDFIGSGTQVANSPELLSSSRMGDLLATVRQRYEVILVDSPPLGVGADSIVLGCLSANMLLLFRSGSTHKDFAQARLEPLGRLPLRLVGAVLNDFEPDKLASSYYHAHYGQYLPGYEAGAEEREGVLEGEPA